MLRASYEPYTLRFIETAITSRARMQVKETFILRLWDDSAPHIVGQGECALFRGLSAEDTPLFGQQLARACESVANARSVNDIIENLPEVSSIRFGFETALADLIAGGSGCWADNGFTRGEEHIQINGLVWMGDKRVMSQRIQAKLDAGFRCVKLKIGGIAFDDELDLLKMIRRKFSASDLELRLDANGAFRPDEAMEKLNRLADFDVHSIEQPIRAGQIEEMAGICASSPIPVALDEELIGFCNDERKASLLDTIRPAYIILKPSLCGGFAEADMWIAFAEERGIGWWATSALESNIGLSAIAQWVSGYTTAIPQGLGTGALFTNNFPTFLSLMGDRMFFIPTGHR